VPCRHNLDRHIDEVLCSLTPACGVAYYHQDALQSVVTLTDGFANKITDYEYDVYGAVTKTTSATDNHILFTGRWLDNDTNLYYYRARWYEPESGRFVTRDPLGVMGGVNLYGYAENNSIRFNDPKGLKVNWGCFAGCAFSCITEHLKLMMDLLLSPIEGASPTPEPFDINEVFDLYRCVKNCLDRCQDKDDHCKGTPNVPMIIPDFPPPVVWGGSGHVKPQWGQGM